MTCVSVALCTHNGARFIAEQINSICRQDFPVSEIVLSDDASTDNCVAVAHLAFKRCLAAQPGLNIRWSVLHNSPALGVALNFQQAAIACEGDLIALCDQDDIWQPGRIKRIVDEFQAKPDLWLLHSDARLVDAQGRDMHSSLFRSLGVRPWEIESIHAGQALDVLLRRNVVAGATTVFRKSLLAKTLPFPPEWLHDEWLATLTSVFGRIDVLNEPWIGYRQHDVNQIGARQASLLDNLRCAFVRRGAVYALRAAKAEVLLERVLCMESPPLPSTIAKLQEKLAHERFRAALPASRWLRVLPVLAELLGGRYKAYGIARYNVIRDLLEPA